MDALNREAAPLSAREWAQLTEPVVGVARRQLVSQRFLSLHGPLGGGTQIVAMDRTPGFELGTVSMHGSTKEDVALERLYQRVPMLYKDFAIGWRDLDYSRSTSMILDWSKAEVAWP